MPIEFHEYIRPTRLDADGGVMLGVRLIKSKPSDMSAAEKRALKRVRAATVEVQRVAKLRDRLRPQNLKDEDRRFDAGWGAVHGELEAWARLSDTAQGRTAAALLTSLFPDGLMFLTRKYEQQWVESQRRFERIEEEALEDTLASLVHPEILAYARAAHDALGEGLGAGAVPLEAPDGATLLDALRALALAVAAYGCDIGAQQPRGSSRRERMRSPEPAVEVGRKLCGSEAPRRVAGSVRRRSRVPPGSGGTASSRSVDRSGVRSGRWTRPRALRSDRRPPTMSRRWTRSSRR